MRCPGAPPHTHLTLVNDCLEAAHALQELVHVVHGLLCGRPGLVLGVALQQDDDDGRDVVHARRRLLEGLRLAQVLLVECVQRRLGLLHQRLGGGQVGLARCLLLADLARNSGALVGLHLG